MRALTRFSAIVALAMVAVACGGDSDETATDDQNGSTSSITEASTSSTGSLVATTISTTTTTQSSTTTTEGATTTTSGATTATTRATTTTSTATTTGSVIDGGPFHDFTSPTGNIACVMTEEITSCWIGEKAWTIDQPDGPDCEISDWGNAVDLDAEGPSFPCYTDMMWNIFAPSLAYGEAVQVGSFRCDSARTGVTCRNGSGDGFTVARTDVQFF